MKKTYIAPKMSMTTINSDEILLVLSGPANNDDALGKERRPRGEEPKDEAWGDLW